MAMRRANPIILGPRIPIAEPFGRMAAIMNIAVPDRVIEPRAASSTTSATASATSTNCPDGDTSALCEKPITNATFQLPIILGVVIPVVGALILFVFLQRRHVRKQREEDVNDRNGDLDFGLGDVPQPGRARKGPGAPPSDEMDYGDEKGGRQRQVSMDLAMPSPYLLPPELQSSRESLHSLSRTVDPHQDPYHPVTQYYPSDSGSIRSYSKNGEGSSIYTGSSKAPSRMQDLSLNTNSELLANASNMPRSSPISGTNGSFVPPPRQNSLPQKSPAASPIDSKPVAAQSPPYPVEPLKAHLEDPNVGRGGLPLPLSPRPGANLAPAPASGDRESFQSTGDAGFRLSNNYLGAFINGEEPPATPKSPSPPPTTAPTSALPVTPSVLTPGGNSNFPKSPRPVRKESIPAVEPVKKDERATMTSDYGDGFQITPPSPTQSNAVRAQRYSMDVPPEEFAQAGLGAPGFDPRRLSMTFRPLPPDAVLGDSEDPEIRANRIRSFYKEYFDESKPAPKGQYYEDYDQQYLGNEAGSYDPNGNPHVRPYAEPIARRAMTPPPNGTPRFQGQGQPRGRQGSMGAMSSSGMSQGGMRGPPQMYPPGPYPQGPKAYSSASGRSGASKRPLPPPAALSTLPTPSKLRDNDLSFDPIDFAPPTSYRDRVAGRSASPLGERRPYSPSVPGFVPTASAFEELAPMPSPHMLRKSGTFTSLDFAPPMKFRNEDSMSDAGSIRSNRSGVSQRTQGAIRNGAYRVSRLPADMVFTKDDLSNQLKPSWGMRDKN